MRALRRLTGSLELASLLLLAGLLHLAPALFELARLLLFAGLLDLAALLSGSCTTPLLSRHRLFLFLCLFLHRRRFLVDERSRRR